MTAKLSRKFYEKLGDEIANELVEWFNLVDASYRLDLKEFNELNFARFDAKLEQRVVELEARVDRVAAELDAKIERVAVELDAKIERRLAELETRLTKRLFGFWIAQAATTAAVVFGVVKLVQG